MLIQDLSAGYKGRGGFNGLALKASREDMAIAQGLKRHPTPKSAKKKTNTVIMIEEDKKPAAKPTASRRQKRKALKEEILKRNRTHSDGIHFFVDYADDGQYGKYQIKF